MMDTLWQDLRYALRSLAKSPGFTLVTLLTLALGIGANTAIFSVVNAVLLRALPFRNPGQLVVVRETYGAGEEGSVSGPNFLDWKTRNHSFAGMTAWRGLNLALVGAGEAEEIIGAVVDADFFKVLGIDPIMGRGFTSGEDRGQATVVVLGETLWRSRFGADPGILGRTISLSGQPHTVIGVAPPSPVLRQGLAMTLTGLGLGLVGTLGLTRLLTSLLYGVSPSDPRVLGGAVLVLAVVSTIACLVPAIRATRVNPIEALRSE
jgi:putative ABC transport system permease protein